MTSTQTPADPHRGQPISASGKPLGQAPVAMVLLHGRGATAESILTLAREFQRPNITYLAPQAAGNTWYPYPFMSPLAQNEPYLTSALGAVRAVLERLFAAGVPPAQTILLGFSQGACLATEYAARNAQRFGGVVGLSGGLIGPPGTPRDYPNSLEGTPVFLGCSDVDPHIPLERVQETTQVLSRLGGVVVEKIYPGMGHTVNHDEIAHVTAMLDSLLDSVG
ncbi:MAG TPA: dienelactone hydrolase family protein [Caldilineaceae bacterium]|nr:dienelactone hydrolase family protein [Caldilineaceae bacterium]